MICSEIRLAHASSRRSMTGTEEHAAAGLLHWHASSQHVWTVIHIRCVSGRGLASCPYGAAAREVSRGPEETESAGAALHQGRGEEGDVTARSAALQCVHRSRWVHLHTFAVVHMFRSHDSAVHRFLSLNVRIVPTAVDKPGQFEFSSIRLIRYWKLSVFRCLI